MTNDLPLESLDRATPTRSGFRSSRPTAAPVCGAPVRSTLEDVTDLDDGKGFGVLVRTLAPCVLAEWRGPVHPSPTVRVPGAEGRSAQAGQALGPPSRRAGEGGTILSDRGRSDPRARHTGHCGLPGSAPRRRRLGPFMKGIPAVLAWDIRSRVDGLAYGGAHWCPAGGVGVMKIYSLVTEPRVTPPVTRLEGQFRVGGHALRRGRP